ncbi:MAG: hypothetical protein M3N51_04270 [Actinomycetota bacterium]|nr:hypothetical protein [Actinomycetota bacterium]
MTAETAGRVGDFPSAVLTFVDESGYPFSLRVRVEPAGEEVRVVVPEGVEVRPGPAGLLCHSHDEELWNQKSFSARGRLSRSEGWLFSPERHVEGLGKGGWVRLVRLMLQGRRRAEAYLAARGLERPAIAWEELDAVKREVFPGWGTRGVRVALVAVSSLYLANAALGTVLALRDGLPARPLGISTGLPPLWDFTVGLGTALSAPLILLVALAVLNVLLFRPPAHRAALALAVLAAGFTAGALVEPVTWSLLGPASPNDPILLVVAGGNILIPAVMIGLSVRVFRSWQPVLTAEAGSTN